ncbi:HNH endonuclease [Salmonella phage ZCSE2]|uniref:HNH endonuclease n=1 Tax=Salmonella phage ZCSE2 TaxID=2562175 RepID=A0A4D6DW02_9CAUD|nr:HNH endonuclease [Salmonella phage ZCSE2]QBZ70505.1 HNH endonuclease [Salmonella phage ZCSE2]
MGRRRIKPEPVDVRGICITEGCTNLQSKCAKDKYRARCTPCHNKRFGIVTHNRDYRSFKKDYCEECGFVPVHPCQLDVDHIDGNHSNDDPSNLKTLCANCHRLKTFVSGDYIPNSALQCKSSGV